MPNKQQQNKNKRDGVEESTIHLIADNFEYAPKCLN